MSKIAKEQKNKISIFRIISKVVDIFVYPIIIFSLIVSCFMLVSKSEKTFTSIMGFSFVKVLSNSMSEYCDEAQRSFFKDDVCILQKGTTYSVGDVIAFYNYIDSVDKNSVKFELTKTTTQVLPKKDKDGNIIDGETKTTKWYPVKDENGNVIYDTKLQNLIVNTPEGVDFIIEDNEGNQSTYTKQPVPSTRKSLQEVEKMDKIKVIFHQIVQIQIDESGTVFYITKGTANPETETELVRSDLALGKYIPSSGWLTNFIAFCSSSTGLILLVIVPISIIIMFEALSVLEQINNIVLEKNVLARNAEFDSKESKKAKICEEMLYYNKIYLYDVMSKDYKGNLFEQLWGYLRDSSRRKDKKVFEVSLYAMENYDENNTEKYYDSWKGIYSTVSKKKKLELMKSKAENDRYKDVKIFEYQNYKPEVLQKNIREKEKISQKLEDSTTNETKSNVEQPNTKQNNDIKQPQKPKIPQKSKISQVPKIPQVPQTRPKKPNTKNKNVTLDNESKQKVEEILERIKQHK